MLRPQGAIRQEVRRKAVLIERSIKTERGGGVAKINCKDVRKEGRRLQVVYIFLLECIFFTSIKVVASFSKC